MKKIYFTEYTYVLHEYPGEVEISDCDYFKLKNSEISMNDIMENYNLEYDGYSNPDYEDFKFDSIQWEKE